MRITLRDGKVMYIDEAKARTIAFFIGQARYANAAAYYNDLFGREHNWYRAEGEAIGKAFAVALDDMAPIEKCRFGSSLS